MAVEEDGKEGVDVWFEDFIYAVATVRLLSIRCQDTTSEDWEDLACPSDL
jgi:hypothetical protein